MKWYNCYLNGNAIINKLCGIVYAYETLRKCFNIVYIAIYIELFQSSLKPGAGPTAGDTTNGKWTMVSLLRFNLSI